MILYPAYFVLLSTFLLNLGSYFDPAFSSIGVGLGMRTVVIQAATLIVVGLIVANRGAENVVWKELLAMVAVWVPFLLYIAVRVDSEHPYSELKFAKVFVISFLCAGTVTATYLCDAREFLRAFPIVIIALSVLLGAEAVMHPQQFKYRTVIDRLTVDGMNPIWLARSFALAGACLFLLPLRNSTFKFFGLALVVAGILPTGSRGPLISLVLTLTVWMISVSGAARVRMAIATASIGVLAVLALLLAGDQIEMATNAYLSRGQNQGFAEESGRPQLFAIAMNDFLSSPVVGVGLGEYGQSAIRGTKAYSWDSSNQGYYPHNIILELLAEVGVLGVILAVVAMRPGKWLLDLRNPYFYLFLLTFLYSMTSGDINGNTGVIIFGTLARLTSQYPAMEEIVTVPEVPQRDAIR